MSSGKILAIDQGTTNTKALLVDASGTELQMLLADGGASQNDMLMQLQADMLGCPVLRSISTDVTALGTAYLAGLAIGLWNSEDEIEKMVVPHDRFEPQMPAEKRDEMYAGWQEAVARTTFKPMV